MNQLTVFYVCNYFVLLAYIFPKDSHNLHEFNIQSKEYELIPDFSFNRYLWECELEFK